MYQRLLNKAVEKKHITELVSIYKHSVNLVHMHNGMNTHVRVCRVIGPYSLGYSTYSTDIIVHCTSFIILRSTQTAICLDLKQEQRGLCNKYQACIINCSYNVFTIT